jgi:hypothetical protein
MAKTTKKHMSKDDKLMWEQLYTYVKTSVLCYDKNQSLSKYQVLRLKGLLNNKFMANNNISDTANYSYEIVLNTFKYCKPNIEKGLRNNTFADENHRFNYIVKIVEANLNTVYCKMKNVKKAKEKIEVIDTDNISEYVNIFKNKERKINKKLDELW